MVTAALLLYFGLTHSSTFGSRTNAIDLLSEIAAPIIIIAIGEVLLLICGEIDLSVGFIFACAPFVMFYLNEYYGIPAGLAILISLAFGVVCGWINGFLTVTLGLPSFITTLGTGFLLTGFALYTSHAESKTIPPATAASATGSGPTRGRSSSGPSSWSRSSTSCSPGPAGGCTRSRPATTSSARARPASGWAGSSTATS